MRKRVLCRRYPEPEVGVRKKSSQSNRKSSSSVSLSSSFIEFSTTLIADWGEHSGEPHWDLGLHGFKMRYQFQRFLEQISRDVAIHFAFSEELFQISAI